MDSNTQLITAALVAILATTAVAQDVTTARPERRILPDGKTVDVSITEHRGTWWVAVARDRTLVTAGKGGLTHTAHLLYEADSAERLIAGLNRLGVAYDPERITELIEQVSAEGVTTVRTTTTTTTTARLRMVVDPITREATP